MGQGLSFEQMGEVVRGARTKFYTGFTETQQIQAFRFQKYIMQHSEEVEPFTAIEWAFRRKDAPGSVVDLDPFQTLQYQRGEYDVSMLIRPRNFSSHLNCYFDRLQMSVNKRNPDKIWDLVKMTYSAAEESAARDRETRFLGPPTSEAAKYGWLGFFAWFPLSQDSSGTFVEQLTPRRNGVYATMGDGTVTSSIATVDRANINNSRLCPLVATHGGVMDDALLTTIDDMLKEAGFEYLEELKGEKPQTATFNILMDQDFHREYDRLLSKAGAPKTRDYFNSGPVTVAGAKVIPIPSFRGHAKRPIFIHNPTNLRLVKQRGNWGVEGEQKIGHNQMAYPMDYTGQFRCEDPSTAGGLIHGSY